MNNLYKVIIVDDEFIIRDGLMSFKWEKFGFTPIGSASDGEEALKLLEQNPADLIITDIKMPFMNGLELSKKIHEKYPSSKIIILTGYKDFEYVHKALRTGVVEYLLKPVDLSELENLAIKIKNILDDDINSTKQIDVYEKQLKECMPLAVENFLRGIIEEKITNMIDIEEKINLMEICLTREFYACSIIQFNIKHTESNNKLPCEFKSILENTLSEFMKNKNLGYFYFNSEFEIVLIFNFDLVETSISTFDFLIKIIHDIKHLFEKSIMSCEKFMIYMGISNIYKHISYLPISYHQAGQALQRRFFDEAADIFYAWKEKSTFLQTASDYPYEKEDILINSILNGDKGQTSDYLKAFWDDLNLVQKQLEPLHFKSMVIQLLNMLERRLNKHGTSLNEIASINPPFTEYIEALSTITNLKQSIENLFLKSSEFILEMNNKAKSSSYAAVQQALKYIEDHYSEKITLNELAEKVFLNPSYFSIQFKKEVGKNFVAYIKEVRIQKAKELLKKVDLKAYEVCEIVGYHDYKYFTETFKKLTGLSPLEYRQKLITS